jgi:hypothetical protein
VTRMDSARAATGTAKGGILHAAEAVAPYAGTAKDATARYAHQARVRLAPVLSRAAHQTRCAARNQYRVRLAPRLWQARIALPPKVDAAYIRTRRAARQAAGYTAPRVGHAMAGARAAAEPVAEEAVTRGAAAVAALRSHVTAADIDRLVRQRYRRERTARAIRQATVIGLLGAGILAAWRWWDRQAGPDWLVEPPAATEVGEPNPLTGVDGNGQASHAADAPKKQRKRSKETRGDGGPS